MGSPSRSSGDAHSRPTLKSEYSLMLGLVSEGADPQDDTVLPIVRNIEFIW